MKNAGTGRKRHRGGAPVDREMVLEYIKRLHLGVNSFYGKWLTFREQNRCGNGPDKSTLWRILGRGWVSDDLGPSLLECFQALLKEAYEEKIVTPEELPMMTSLDMWSIAAKRRQKKWQGGEVLTWRECVEELRKRIMAAEEHWTLYASIGTGMTVTAVLDHFSKGVPNIKSVVLRRLSDAFLDRLEAMGLIEKIFRTRLSYHLYSIKERLSTEQGIPVTLELWDGMAPFHGVMYGRDVMFYGAWQYSLGSLNTTDGPMFRLGKADGELFNVYKRLLEKGDSDTESGRVVIDQSEEEWG